MAHISFVNYRKNREKLSVVIHGGKTYNIYPSSLAIVTTRFGSLEYRFTVNHKSKLPLEKLSEAESLKTKIENVIIAYKDGDIDGPIQPTKKHIRHWLRTGGKQYVDYDKIQG
jgi:hypothetical protein